jgi:aspartyl-tRNA(Asn)/glutamyl-tRNA(Gln) amidotransferase subunit A
MAADPTSLTVLSLARAYRSGELDPVEVTEAYLAAIDRHPQGDLVYRRVTAERARRQAQEASRMFRAGVDTGPLQGVPLAVKDLFDMEGEVSAAGSKVLLERPPAEQDAPVLARLDAAGAVFLGRTTMTELAFSGIGINPHFGTPSCVRDADRVPGGSSSGSGVAVASGLAAAALGSDTGGSVRIPAAVNGIVGLKTTDGRIPTEGAVPLSTTLDTVGPLARDADDAWALFQAMAAEPYRGLAEPPERLVLLAPTTVLQDDLEGAVEDVFRFALARLEALGMEVRESDLPMLAEVPQLYRRYGSFASHEAFALYEDLLTERGDAMDPRVVARILQVGGRPSADYIRLGYARADLRRRFWPELAGVDAILAPTLAILPPRVDALSSDSDYFTANARMLRNTTVFNVLASPAVSVPAGDAPNGLFVGLMVVTRPGEEALALGIARRWARSGGPAGHAEAGPGDAARSRPQGR